MSQDKKTYLKIISSFDLRTWDVKSHFKSEDIFKDKIPLLVFGSFLSKGEISKIQIQDNKKYKILGVRSYGKGAYLNRVTDGKDLKMKTYQIAQEDHLFWCKVDTKNGAFGVIKEDLKDGIASSNMTFAKINTKKINTEYLQILFKSKKINAYMDTYVTGTTNRKYIKPNQLLNEIKIPLPSVEEQNRLLENYNAKIALAQNQEKEAKEIEESIEKYLFDELGIEKIEEKKKSSKLQFIESKNINRWDVLFLIGNIPVLKAKYPIVKFSKLITNFNTDKNQKSLRINSKEYPNKDFTYIGMEHIEKETGTLLEANKVKGIDIKSQTIKVPKDYLIYGKLRPYLNKFWLNKTDYNNIICSSEFFVFDIDENTNKLFFKYCLSSKFIQMQITDKTSGARMPRINEVTFMSLDTPIPPIEIQNIIAKEITKRKNKIKQLKKEAIQNRDSAIREFEEEIFAK